ncbi:PP2C family protein-serine/threonine phosphatase [Streptomyces sp. NPDC057654]|uniref:PP2C family protein-serine/threonine phosphatase n=1 Tax=Streptomyces sp. NPDC057654 TaxID=3346196 RepID=UPI0036A82AEC
MAGINPSLPAPEQTAAPVGADGTAIPAASGVPGNAAPTAAVPPPAAPGAVLQDRLAGWVSDLTTLHELTERIARAGTLDAALHELLRGGSALVGARRGLITLQPVDGLGPVTTVGLGLGRADLGHIETIPRASLAYGRLLEGLPEPGATGEPEPGSESRTEPGTASDGEFGTDFDTDLGTDFEGLDAGLGAEPPVGVCPDPGAPPEPDPGVQPSVRPGIAHPDIAGEPGRDPRHREVAARLGYAASYAVPLATDATGRLGAAVWLYDEPAEPTERQRHLVGLYCAYAAEHLARHLELDRARAMVATLREELLPSRLPRVTGVRLAVRHRTGPHGGGDWYDALPLPEGALGLAVGGVTGSGPSAVAAMGRLRASLRAYAVMEGEDPVAVLSDLELLLRLTEPARSATALFAYCEPTLVPRPDGSPAHKIVLAGAGHCPPLLIGDDRVEYVETSLSAPLGMLSCWEAPSVELEPGAGETLLLYSDGLLHRTGDSMDRAFARLHAAAAGVPAALRGDPEAVVDHVLRTVLPDGLDEADSDEDVILLAARFD